MIYSSVLKAIREGHGLSQEAFANKLGCTADYICALEDSSKNREHATPEFVHNLRTILDLHDAPLTKEEKDQFTEELHRWKDLIDYGEITKATELKPELARRAKSSFRPGLQILYDLYEARYYRAVDDKEAYEKIMESLSERKLDFNDRCNYLYHRLVAMSALGAHRLKEAHIAFNSCEKIDKDSKWADVGFYYAYGLCLSYMGYALRAIEYFKKALHRARWSTNYDGKANRRYNVYIESWLAQNYGKTGNTTEALFILNGCLRNEKKKNKTSGLGFICHSFGRVYHEMERFSEALENYDEAFKYHNEGSVAYLSNLNHKTIALIASDRICEAMQCVDKGLNMSTDELWKALFEALKHSVLLSNPESLDYMINTAIPKLLELELNEEAMAHHVKLSKFYESIGNHKQRAEHSDSALEIQKQLYKERVERGL